MIAVMNRLDAELIEKANSYLAGQQDVLLAYLFGSYGREAATPLSDIDVGLLLIETLSTQNRFERRLTVGLDLQRIFHSNDVDVVILNDAPLALAYRVLRDGQILCCRDEDIRVQYTASTVGRYLDFKPFIERHQQAILERARRGELLNGHNPYHGALARYRQGRTSFAENLEQ